MRPGRAQALAATGLVVKSRFGDLSIASPPVVLTGRLRRPFDVVVVGCKAYDLAETITWFARPSVPARRSCPCSTACAIWTICGRVSARRVLGGLCLISATLDAQGTVQHLNDLHALVFGELAGGSSPRVEGYRPTSRPRSSKSAPRQMLQEMWEKWVFIASVAGLTCLMRASIGGAFTAPAANPA